MLSTHFSYKIQNSLKFTVNRKKISSTQITLVIFVNTSENSCFKGTLEIGSCGGANYIVWDRYLKHSCGALSETLSFSLSVQKREESTVRYFNSTIFSFMPLYSVNYKSNFNSYSNYFGTKIQKEKRKL